MYMFMWGLVGREGMPLHLQKVPGQIATPFCYQRHLTAGPYKSGSPEHKGTAWPLQSRREAAGRGHACPLVSGQIPGMGCNHCAHLRRLVITTRAAARGSAAEQAADSKILKYGELSSSFTCKPVAIETLGQFKRWALEFIGELGNRISLITGNKRETSFLFKKLYVC